MSDSSADEGLVSQRRQQRLLSPTGPASAGRFLVVCVNPVLDLIFDGFDFTDADRDFFDSSTVSAGGFGPNVARSLRISGHAPVCFLSTGGWSGELLRLKLEEEAQEFHDHPSGALTRVAALDLGANGPRMTVGPTPELGDAGLHELGDRLLDVSTVDDVILVGGSLPAADEPVFLTILERLCRERPNTCLDIRTTRWRHLLDLRPHILKLPASLSSGRARAAVGSHASDGPASLLVWSSRPYELSAWASDGLHRIGYPCVEAKNPFGAGDCLMAVLASELGAGRELDEALRVAAASATASVETVLPGDYEPCRARGLAEEISFLEPLDH